MRVGLRDGMFHQPSLSLGGDNRATGPTYFQWDRTLPAQFYTDMDVYGPYDDVHPRVALLIEPPPFRPRHHEYVRAHAADFDYVITSVKDDIERDPAKWLMWPGGGSWIAPQLWGHYTKTGLVSLLASDKAMATGHLMRWAIYSQYRAQLAVHGTIGGGAYCRSIDALAPYYYSIICETERLDWRFTEKLIDCLAVGTVPIYWGCPDIGKFFDTRGILQFETLAELDSILQQISPADYWQRISAIKENRRIAQAYRIAEDWIYEHYPFLFREVQ